MEWIGEVPSHWTTTPIYRVASFNDEVLTESTPANQEIEYVEISGVNAALGITETHELQFGAAPSRARRVVRNGDILISTVRTYLRAIASVPNAPDNLVASTGFCVLRPRHADSGFLGYAVRSEAFISEVIARSVGVSYPAINASDLVRISLALPPEAEQVAIAAFLDRETAKIDALIEEQRRLIALLKEKRQAVISHAVTKGLDPHVTMKDSGSRWLGEVPAHWATMPLMRLTAPGRDIMYGIVLPGPDVGAGGVPIVKGGDVKPHRLRLDLLNRTTAEIEAPFARARLKPNDIVYSIRGSIGDAEPVPPDLEGANITQDVARVSARSDVNSRWLLYVMKSNPIFVQLEQRSLGAAVRGINIFDLKRACVPVPPRAEQAAIADHLNAETRRIDELSGVAEAGIALLRERRAALISAAVTGKIDVRGSAKVLPFPIERARARALVGTEIIERSAGQPTFGRVKFQKMAFLAEGHVGISELAGCYTRAAAGPLDGALIDEMEHGANSIAGIEREQPGGAGTTNSYRLTQPCGAHRQELADSLGPDRTAKLDKLIADFAPLNTKQAEAVATLYGVWNDLLSEGASPSDDEIITGFLNDWHPEKREKFRAGELSEWLGWMRRHGIVPTGSGPKTTTGRLFV